MNIDSQTLTGIINYFKDTTDIKQFVQAFKNPADLRELLEKTGIDPEEINKFLSKLEVDQENNSGEVEQENNSGDRESLAFGLIVASFVVLQL